METEISQGKYLKLWTKNQTLEEPQKLFNNSEVWRTSPDQKDW